ncbi:hypothetical protein SPFM5_00124 [Salmonella phage SPFM5]|nr:hypothetical protein SPFM5_00124 [Salmonella phage SPFM5]
MNNTSSQWYNRPPYPESPFDDIPVGPIDSVTAQQSAFFDGEWFNTFARLYNYSGQFPRLFDYKFWTSYVGSGNTELYLGNQRRTVTKNGYEYVVRLPYYQGMMYGQDGNGYVPGWATAHRILFMSDNSIINASPQFIYSLVVNMFSSAVGAWHKFIYKNAGYFGTVTPAELFTNTELNAQGFFLDTGPGPQKLLYGDWPYRYWIAAVKDGERVFNTPTVATLPGDATSYEDNAVENNTKIYRKTPGNATIDVNAPGTPLIMPITLHFAQRKPQALDSIACPWCDRGRYLDSSNRAYRGYARMGGGGFH